MRNLNINVSFTDEGYQLELKDDLEIRFIGHVRTQTEMLGIMEAWLNLGKAPTTFQCIN